jgi:hypothetical protein
MLTAAETALIRKHLAAFDAIWVNGSPPAPHPWSDRAYGHDKGGNGDETVGR